MFCIFASQNQIKKQQMINFILGLAIGGVIAIFVYRNNKAKISKYADKIDELVDKLDKK